MISDYNVYDIIINMKTKFLKYEPIHLSNSTPSEIVLQCFTYSFVITVLIGIVTIIWDTTAMMARIWADCIIITLALLIDAISLHYISKYNKAIKIISWISIAGSILFVVLGIISTWMMGNNSGFSTFMGGLNV